MLLNFAALLLISLLNVVIVKGATSTSSAPVATHTVSVGGDGLNFSPNQLYANVGDIIEYFFYPQNHSVARAAFYKEPCIPYELTGAGRVGFWSGFKPVALVLTNAPTFQVRVNDTEPIFFYCSSPGACLEGMIGVINPNSTFTFAQQFNYTQNATLDLSPGEYFPAETAKPTRTTTATGATMTPTPTPTAAITSSSTTTPSPTAAAVVHHGLGPGPIAGIAIGGVAVVVLAAAVLYMCGRQRTVKEMMRQHTAPQPNHNSYQPASAGVSEVHYPNMSKTPNVDVGRFSGNTYSGPPGTETESYRSMSPPADERTGMMGMQHRSYPNGQGSPGLGVMSPGTPNYPSPTYYDTHEMENTHGSVGLRPYNPATDTHAVPIPRPNGPHEMPVPSPTDDSNERRPFSYTDSESGYTKPPKSEGGTY